jgi:hypothetical protein
MTQRFDAETVTKAMASPRWSALVRTGLDLSAVVTWDPGIVRESRVLVPIDVQALYVPQGSTENMVRIPLALTAPDGQPPVPPTPVLDPGAPRPAGVHLHWAPPDALLRGTMTEASANRLQLPPLPDRWVVVRLLVPKGADAPHVRGFVLEADTAKAVPLEQYPAGASTTPQAGRTVPVAELTGGAGGSLNWTGVYDAGTNRLSFFDPLDDLANVAPNGVEGDQAAYLVAGWWSTPALDPLDGAQTTASLHDRLHTLGWALTDDLERGDSLHGSQVVTRLRRTSLGLDSATRYRPVSANSFTTGTGGGVQPAAARSDIDLGDAIRPQVFTPSTSVFTDEVGPVVQTDPAWPRSVLLHGAIYGVPVAGTPTVDNRPKSEDVGVVLGEQGDDLAAALASAGLASDDPEERRALERLLSAFTGQLLDRVGSADGLVDVEEHEHASAFVSRQGGAGGTDRLQSGRQAGGFAVGRQGRSTAARVASGATSVGIAARVASFAKVRSELRALTLDDQRGVMVALTAPRPEVEPVVEPREVVRPAPRFHVPTEPMIAVRGGGRSLIHGNDGRFSPDGLLHCRWPSQVTRGIDQVVEGRDLLPTLGTGGVPDEVTLLAQEALVFDPYLAPWLAATAAKRNNLDPAATAKRVLAEAALRFGTNAVYDGRTAAFQPTARAAAAAGRPTFSLAGGLVADQLRRFSLVVGTDPDPVGVTAWSQPWIPLWLEWEAALDVADRFDGWALQEVDDELVQGANPPTTRRTFRGRSPLTTGTATTLGAAIRGWLAAEDQRDQAGQGEADEATEAALTTIADAIEHLDVLAASLDGIREQLLGFRYDSGLVRVRKDDGTLSPPATTGDAPSFFRAGRMTVTKARLVDAFGRVLDLPVDQVRVPVRGAVTDAPSALLLRPRLTLPARFLFRFVDPAAEGADAAEATVDQVDPDRMVNPVAGFLLPDHIDEALEVFDVAGAPLGQLSHEPIGGGVVWEIAPGRSGPPDAGPLLGLAGGTRHAGFLAAGVVAADARERKGAPADPDRESALSALLRAIDTTLWTVDAFQGIGSEHIAGLVGRPIAIVRARLSLDIGPDLGLEPAAATAALADRAFTVRVGELTRADDVLLAYFVDDDYEHVRVVDKVVAELALESRRQKGQLGRYATTPQVPPTKPIDHPYVVAEDELKIRPGQVVRLTLLLVPGGNVHLTSGVVPRKSLQLARDWVAPGLAVMAPSARVGPVLVDPAQVRLPKISAFPKNQVFTRRATPSTWKDDPILAATQTALLPDLPHEVQEGYIRIAPEQEKEP